ncbi:carboxylesterase family protein [Porticoccaceae bacterium]|nr:carboxylesterase family protein [Porticoccaceae bacterium]
MRRWKPAEVLPRTRVEMAATAFGPAAMQPTISNREFLYYHPGFLTSEDCLYLNVWTPTVARSGDKLPVMVWFHGGGFIDGATSSPLYDGASLARHGVIVVTVGYRLGAFGFFSHPALSSESPHGVSGNCGITDQIAALRWVRSNIAAFGGDRDNITIFGQSAGAVSVSYLMASPLCKGLFHKAILQSPYLMLMPALREPVHGYQSAEEVGECFAAKLGISGAGATVLERLRALPATTVLEAASEFSFDKAAVDGHVFQEQVISTFERLAQCDIPVIIGSNANEGVHIPSFANQESLHLTPETYAQAIEARYGELATEYLEVYPFDDSQRMLIDPLTDGFWGWGTTRLLQSCAALSSKTYHYLFSHASEEAQRRGLGAYHGSELNYVFNNLGPNSTYGPNMPAIAGDVGDVAIAEAMSRYWTNFAKTGDPNGATLPEWTPYDAGDQAYMTFEKGAARLSRKTRSREMALQEKLMRQRMDRGDHWFCDDHGLLAPVWGDEEVTI